MQPVPETAAVGDDPPLSGNCWIEELPSGDPLRFRLGADGAVAFAVGPRTHVGAAAVPLAHRRAARAVVTDLDRAALRAAVDDTAAVTFVGRTVRSDGVEYDAAALPAFVGVDVWPADRDGPFSPDAAATVFDRLGLATLPAIERELPADRIDSARYRDGDLPPSAWGDGPAAGVLLRDKTGGRAVAWRDRPEEGTPDRPPTAAEAADRYVTPERIDRTVRALRAADRPATVDAVRTRLLERLAVERSRELFDGDDPVVSVEELASIAGERIQRRLDG